MRQIHCKKRVEATPLPLISTQIPCGIRKMQAFPRTLAHAIRQPRTQYRLALLFATILAFLLGWGLFVSPLPHATPLVFTGHPYF